MERTPLNEARGSGNAVSRRGREMPRARRFLFWAILLEILVILVFIAVLLVGERSRMTLIFLYLPRLPLLLAATAGAALAPIARRHVKVIAAVNVVLALVVVFPVMGLSLAGSKTGKEPIRFTSYNVFWGHGGQVGRQKLVDEIAAQPLDVVMMQAANSSMKELLEKRFPDRHVHQEGEFVLMTRFPIRSAEAPPPLPDGTEAMYMKYVIETPAGPLRLYNVHPFSPRHALFADEETAANIQHREEQIAAAVTAARTDVPPFILAGDTNLPPMSSIGRRHLDGLKDAFEEAGFGFGYTFTAKRPWMRIDRAFGTGVRFLGVRVAEQGISDHRELFFEAEIER